MSFVIRLCKADCEQGCQQQNSQHENIFCSRFHDGSLIAAKQDFADATARHRLDFECGPVVRRGRMPLP